jgi:hypothetical protein
LRFRGKKNTPHNWFRAEQAEEVWSYVLCAQGTWLAETGNAGRVVETSQSDVFKDVILLVPIDLLGDGRSIALVGMSLFGLPNHDQLLGLRIGQRAVQESIENAVDGTVGRNSQSQRQNDHRQEPRIFQETAYREAYIGTDYLECSKHFHVSPYFQVKLASVYSRAGSRPETEYPWSIRHKTDTEANCSQK